jgi:hypothetical protein
MGDETRGWLGIDPSDWLGIVGFALTVLGFAVTICQLRRTTKATDAARLALEAAAQTLGINHLLVLLPQIQALEVDMDVSSLDNDKKLAIRTLIAVRHIASQAATLMDTDPTEKESELIEMLNDFSKVAARSKALLVSGTDKQVSDVLKSASSKITLISGRASGLVASYQAKVN